MKLALEIKQAVCQRMLHTPKHRVTGYLYEGLDELYKITHLPATTLQLSAMLIVQV